MKDDGVVLRPDPAYIQAFSRIIGRIEKALGPRRPARPVVLCVAGGAAMHFYTGERFSNDIDAKILARVLLDPQELQVTYSGEDGRSRLLYFDMQYNDSFALLHHDAYGDARPIDIANVDARRLEVRLLTPLDLAVSKLTRFSEQDQADICSLARAGLLTATAVRRRATAALPDYVGGLVRVKNSIAIACRMIASNSKLKREARRR